MAENMRSDIKKALAGKFYSDGGRIYEVVDWDHIDHPHIPQVSIKYIDEEGTYPMNFQDALRAVPATPEEVQRAQRAKESKLAQKP